MAESSSTFISYRRSTSAFIARAVFQDLRNHGIDAFMDVENIDSGRFDTIILNQIAARPYFLLILTPGTLDRCADPDDWVRREIEHAMNLDRIIIPLVTPNFDWGDLEKYLGEATGKEFGRFNAVNIPHDYFEAAMDRLRARFLKPVQLSVQPVPEADKAEVQRRIEQAAAEPAVTEEQLSAQDHFEQGMAHLHDNPERAMRSFNEAIQLNAQFAEAYAGRGALRALQGDREGAITDLGEAIRYFPDWPEIYYTRAGLLTQLGRVDEALIDLNRALEIDPEHALARYGRGAAYFTKHEFEQAIADFDIALRHDPENASAYMQRGMSHHALRHLEQAIADYDEYLRREPEDIDVYLYRGAAQRDLGDFDAALADYQAARRLAKDPARAEEIQDWIGQLLERKRQSSALAPVPARPADAITYLERGMERAEADLAGALADFDEAIRLDPTLAGAYVQRGTGRMVLHQDYAGAIADLTESLRLLPGNADAYLYRGLAYRLSGNFDQALADYTEALRLDPARPDAYLNRARTYRDKGDYNAAASDLQIVIKVYPDSPQAQEAQEESVKLLAQMMGNAAVDIGKQVWNFFTRRRGNE